MAPALADSMSLRHREEPAQISVILEKARGEGGKGARAARGVPAGWSSTCVAKIPSANGVDEPGHADASGNATIMVAAILQRSSPLVSNTGDVLLLKDHRRP